MLGILWAMEISGLTLNSLPSFFKDHYTRTATTKVARCIEILLSQDRWDDIGEKRGG